MGDCEIVLVWGVQRVLLLFLVVVLLFLHKKEDKGEIGNKGREVRDGEEGFQEEVRPEEDYY